MAVASIAAFDRCAYRNTIVVTVATSKPYLDAAHELAQSAQAVGIPCTLIALPKNLQGRSRSPLEELPLPPAVAAWLPPREWCTPNRTDRSGYRQTHILKTQAMVVVLRERRDALFIDADRHFLINPVPSLEATGADVAAMRDTELLNIGLVWLRGRAGVLGVAERVANRSYAAWDQAVLNEELAAATGVSCCYTNAFIKQQVGLSEVLHRLRRSGDAEARQAEQPGCTATAAPPLRALGPPPRAKPLLFRVWSPNSFNVLSLEWRRFSRCSTRPCPQHAAGSGTPAGSSTPVGSGTPVGSSTPVGSGTPVGSSTPAHPRIDAFPQATPNVARPLGIRRSSTASSDPSGGGTHYRCTTWPTSAPASWSDARRCEQGNSELQDGFEYVHNALRGTPMARCLGGCACCRRRKKPRVELET
jgi:hypothetical protein